MLTTRRGNLRRWSWNFTADAVIQEVSQTPLHLMIINSIAHLAILPNPLKRSNGLTGELKKIGQDQKANGWEAIKLKVGCRSTF